MTTLNKQRVAVTGATGFLGSHIARALREHGATVRAVIRTPSKGAFLEAKGVELFKADLGDPEGLTRAFSGCDAVISNAALAIRGRANWEAYYQANVRGTENVFKAINTHFSGTGGAGTQKVYSPDFYKGIFLRVQNQNVVEYNVYLDMLLMVPIYVIKY